MSVTVLCPALRTLISTWVPSLSPWTQCAFEALCSRDVKALRSRLPELLQASDERVLQALAPSCEAHGVASLMGSQMQAPEMAVEAEPHPTLAQVHEVSELAGPLPTAWQAPVASQLAEASLTSAQAHEAAQPALEPMHA